MNRALTRILHVSDLHVGAREAVQANWALAPLIDQFDPELLLVTGDLTHRGKAEQHETAAALLHQHLIGAPWRSRKKPVARRNRVLGSLVDAGAELIVAGHIHQGAVAERREFEVSAGIERAVTVSVAPGLGQHRPHRRGEARGLHVYEFDDTHLGVRTYTWREGG